MFSKLAFRAVAITSAAQAAVVGRADVTREVNIPDGQTIDDFCTLWANTCVDLAHREGKSYNVCSAGYDGSTSARVDCLALTTPVTDFTDKVVVQLNLTYAS